MLNDAFFWPHYLCSARWLFLCEATVTTSCIFAPYGLCAPLLCMPTSCTIPFSASQYAFLLLNLSIMLLCTKPFPASIAQYKLPRVSVLSVSSSLSFVTSFLSACYTEYPRMTSPPCTPLAPPLHPPQRRRFVWSGVEKVAKHVPFSWQQMRGGGGEVAGGCLIMILMIDQDSPIMVRFGCPNQAGCSTFYSARSTAFDCTTHPHMKQKRQ